MIVRPRPSPLKLLFAWRGTILPRLLPQVLGVAALSCCVVWAFRHTGLQMPHASPPAMSLLGIALSIFLGFRNSACYDRWWEARKQWGTMIVELRSFSRDAIALLDDGRGPLPELGRDAARALVHRNIAFGHALAAHLRGHDESADMARLLPGDECARVLASAHRPEALLREHALELARLRRAGQLSDFAWGALDDRVNALCAVLTACERLRSTPLPFSYTVLLHRTAYLFCLLLPFGLADSVGWFTPVVATLVAYTFFGLDRLGDELEEPFGTDPNDLPLLALARTAERNLLEALGEPMPEPLQPRGYVLS
ncbi:bestrophin [Aggregicoccus sp. 17bor-14]|uniref:bestrophin family protein n=1 Tax=Myxococcaceae TaxID=31 RepID=UPI00129C7398|nr:MULTISPECIES: bestrophin family protein [Myxococcaceae]MBF5040982.1 bestrophin family protein [Simulacricoccus sp. 17bor-14]MRI86769.1 bestrophin [Aggregicoccus sp. 17bor-14]